MEIKLETKLTIKSLLVTKATFKHQLKNIGQILSTESKEK